MITHRFSAYSPYEVAETFNALKQDTPELTEEWFVKCFVNGLRHDIKHQLRPLHPESLTDAYWQAKDMERSAPPKKQFSSYQRQITAAPYRPFVQNLLPPHQTKLKNNLRLEEIRERLVF
jgi:hypothetical protein